MICRFLSALAVLSLSFSTSTFAVTGNPKAPKGGVFYYHLPSEPSSLNPITASDLYSRAVREYAVEQLLRRNQDTYEWDPEVADKWEISKDGKQFTFHLRKDAKFADGKPVTADDVKFTFDAIFNPKFNAAHLRPYYEGLEKVEVLDTHTVRFTAKERYWGNFDSAAEIDVLPKHKYGDPDKGHKMNKEVHGSGPYLVESYDRGQKITLKRNPNWWGLNDPDFKGKFNFDKIVFRFVKEDSIALETFKKGDLDFIGLTPEQFVQKATGPMWGKSVLKVKAENKQPKSYGFIGWNFKNPLFQDKLVRKALSHLLNRELMIEKFRFGMSLPATGPWYRQSEYASSKVKALLYDPKKALALFREAGWSDSDKDGVLDKTVDGRKTNFRFTLIYANPDAEKYYTVFKEDAAKAGVQMELKLLEWNSFVKLLDEQNFDAVSLAWGGGSVDPEPKQIWHSSSSVAGGSNFISYKNPEVDKLIDEARGIFDKKKRITLMRKIYEMIADDAPYTWLFVDKFATYGRSARMGVPKDTLGYKVGVHYWWVQK